MDLLADVGEAKLAAEPGVRARDVFRVWELWLRPAYNIVLALESLVVCALLWWLGFRAPRAVILILVFGAFGLAANVLFTAGPLLDCYVSTVTGRRSKLLTASLFGLGLLLSMITVPLVLDDFWRLKTSWIF